MLNPWWRYHVSAPLHDRSIVGNIGDRPWQPREPALGYSLGLAATFVALHVLARCELASAAVPSYMGRLYLQWLLSTLAAVAYVNLVVCYRPTAFRGRQCGPRW